MVKYYMCYEQVFEAANAANAMAFIRKAPAGMRTLVSHPSLLSKRMAPHLSILSSRPSDFCQHTCCLIRSHYEVSMPGPSLASLR